MLIDANADAAIGDLDARVVNEGANLGIVEAKSPGELLFREQMDGLLLASPIQIYLDLLRGEGRSKKWPSTSAKKGSASDGQAHGRSKPKRRAFPSGS